MLGEECHLPARQQLRVHRNLIEGAPNEDGVQRQIRDHQPDRDPDGLLEALNQDGGDEHHEQQRDGDLVRDGVCSLFIADKLGVSQPTCGEHLKVLSRAGLIRGTKIKQWVFYQRDEARIAAAKELLSGDW